MRSFPTWPLISEDWCLTFFVWPLQLCVTVSTSSMWIFGWTIPRLLPYKLKFMNPCVNGLFAIHPAAQVIRMNIKWLNDLESTRLRKGPIDFTDFAAHQRFVPTYFRVQTCLGFFTLDTYLLFWSSYVSELFFSLIFMAFVTSTNTQVYLFVIRTRWESCVLVRANGFAENAPSSYPFIIRAIH